ncbi:flagellar transcriptional regulator FlhC [Cupriavidus metallidurans]|uniref:Flagellar transcriptional regulator FlhC n=1 Tax=Cupriavidus metallidurans (strain ATCC 43123 / DSM 2839 / NBRC 102507 / CH34) TaxID=266264 RepID=FLHC_CUPMC|nr:flagellar transcriptional regulator FlhC [Cupriavidus metallidurans]Q1LMQ4.1 RecName: Full=Flagellar transcriptional regulator FlhC [Cupriavidus metallidurans CH34]ABF08572.1 DNA-binding transcriptional dual regulator with FlhD [Cupriavidus metallidurans CH34]QGS30487.1 flagellar transcriptional regulator FlhC [Cupriavidus metallidurans]
MTTRKSVLREVEEFRLAVELVELGARLQVLESEVAISRDRLTRLYKELRGVSPPKGQLPSSPEWFLTWRPNVHASLFLSAYRFLMAQGKQSRIRCIVSAYRLYVEHISLIGEDLTLSFTRAWTMLRFLDSGTLVSSTCKCCGGSFVRHKYDLQTNFVCGLCAPPPRAAKGKKLATSAEPFVVPEDLQQTISIEPAAMNRPKDAPLRRMGSLKP